jgi:hypothetical protein
VRLFSPSPLITLIVKTVPFLHKGGRATQAVGLDECHYAADVSACMSELLHYVLHVTLTMQVRCLNGETKQIWKLCKVGSRFQGSILWISELYCLENERNIRKRVVRGKVSTITHILRKVWLFCLSVLYWEFLNLVLTFVLRDSFRNVRINFLYDVFGVSRYVAE